MASGFDAAATAFLNSSHRNGALCDEKRLLKQMRHFSNPMITSHISLFEGVGARRASLKCDRAGLEDFEEGKGTFSSRNLRGILLYYNTRKHKLIIVYASDLAQRMVNHSPARR